MRSGPQISNPPPPLVRSTVPLGIHTDISTSPLISAAPQDMVLFRIVTTFY